MNSLNTFKSCGAVKTTITGKLLYLLLCELADAKGETIVPQKSVSRALNISPNTISCNLRRLHNEGYIDIYARYSSEGGRMANQYRIR